MIGRIYKEVLFCREGLSYLGSEWKDSERMMLVIKTILIGIVDVSSLDHTFEDNNGQQLCDRRYYLACMKEEIVLDHLHLPSTRMRIVLVPSHREIFT